MSKTKLYVAYLAIAFANASSLQSHIKTTFSWEKTTYFPNNSMGKELSLTVTAVMAESGAAKAADTSSPQSCHAAKNPNAFMNLKCGDGHGDARVMLYS